MDPGVLLLPALVAGGVALGGWALRVEHQRGAALRALAAERGWSLVRRDDAWVRALSGEPFGRGSTRRAENVLTGSHGGRDLVAFDYSFRTSSAGADGQAQVRVHRYAVAVLRLPVAVPLVELEPAGPLARLLPGRQQLESEAFNDRYRVRADDARLASDLLPARSMQLLLDRPDVSLRLLGGVAVTWAAGRLEPDALLVRLDTVTALLDAVPAWAWEDRA